MLELFRAETGGRVLVATTLILLGASVGVRAESPFVERSFLERDGRRHGEVRLVDDQSCVSLQTVLYSRLLRRVVREIAAKERADHPDGSEFEADRAVYLASLDEARAAAERRRGSAADRRGLMLIEFARCGPRRTATIAGLRLGGPPEALELLERVDPRPLAVSAGWIDDRMRAVAGDALGLDEAAFEALIAD